MLVTGVRNLSPNLLPGCKSAVQLHLEPFTELGGVRKRLPDARPGCVQQNSFLDAVSIRRHVSNLSMAFEELYLALVLFFVTFVVLALSKLLLAQLRKGEGARA